MARYALVVGITEYSHLPSLTKAAKDAEAIARLLEQHGNFQEVKRLPADWVEAESRYQIASKALNGDRFGQELQAFLEQAKNSEALIYFSGHGIQVCSSLGLKRGYLAASDCEIEGDGQRITQQRYGIALNDLNDLVYQADFSNLVMLLDCCHSGYLLERHLTQQTLTAFTGKQDYYLIAASRKFEQAWEGTEYSIFTEAVLKGLSSDNQDEDGNVTGDRLFHLVDRELQQKGQEPIRMGIGRSLTIVSYRSHNTTTEINEACPYQGLEAFTAETKQFFFGRKAVIEQLRQNLEQSNFVALIGTSGSGKSSVVRAGLIPWLEELGWQVLPPIKPGFQPIAELKRSFASLFRRPQDIRQVHELVNAEDLSGLVNLLPGSERLLLVVDQFEEVFTVCGEEPEQEKERRRFIRLLTQVENQRLAVVITMRADFMEPCLSYTSLTQQLDHAVYIPPLDGEGLREAIAKPAQLQGYTLDPGLLALILRDVEKEKNCLPLLQFTLKKLWELATHNKHRLTIEQYEQLGGVTGALDRYAQQICDRLTPQEQDWARRLCLKLVRTREGTRDTRQRQLKRELLGLAGNDPQALETLQSVLIDLVDGRLLVTGEEGGEAWIDLAHEALMEGWQQFAEWRQSDREVRRLCDRMEDARREWEQNGRDINYLLSKGLLLQAETQAERLSTYITPILQEFYRRSVAREQERENLLAWARKVEMDKEAQQLQNVLLSKPIESLAATLKLTGLSLVQQKDVLESVQATLHQAMKFVYEQNCWQHGTTIHSVSFSPDGKMIASGGEDGTVRLSDLAGNPVGQPFRGHEDSVYSVSFSPDSKTIASGGEDGTVRLWNLAGNLINHPYPVHNNSSVYSISFAPDGKMIASGGGDGLVQIDDLAGKSIELFCGHGDVFLSVSFSPDSKRIASGCNDGTVWLWTLANNNIEPSQDYQDRVWAVSFWTESKTNAREVKGVMRSWTVTDSPFEQPLQYYGDSVRCVSFSPDGNTIASGGEDGTVRLWNLAGNLVGQPFRGHEGSVCSVSFSPDGKTLASGGEDGTIRLWDLVCNPIVQSFKGHEVGNLSANSLPDGQTIASSGADGAIHQLQEGTWRDWLEVCCNRIRYHPYFTNPTTEEARAACEVCRKWVWEKDGKTEA